MNFKKHPGQPSWKVDSRPLDLVVLVVLPQALLSGYFFFLLVDFVTGAQNGRYLSQDSWIKLKVSQKVGLAKLNFRMEKIEKSGPRMTSEI